MGDAVTLPSRHADKRSLLTDREREILYEATTDGEKPQYYYNVSRDIPPRLHDLQHDIQIIADTHPEYRDALQQVHQILATVLETDE